MQCSTMEIPFHTELTNFNWTYSYQLTYFLSMTMCQLGLYCCGGGDDLVTNAYILMKPGYSTRNWHMYTASCSYALMHTVEKVNSNLMNATQRPLIDTFPRACSAANMAHRYINTINTSLEPRVNTCHDITQSYTQYKQIRILLNINVTY